MSTPYDTAALALSPDSYWQCDEASGNILDKVASNDLLVHGSGESRNVTGYNATVGNGINLNATAWLIHTTAIQQVTADHFSVCGWFSRVTDLGTNEPFICASFSGGHTDPYYTFLLDSGAVDANNFWRYVLDTTGAFATNQSGSNTGGTVLPADGTWHHLALVYDGAHIFIYKDGSQDFTHAITGNIGSMGSFGFGCIPALDDSGRGPIKVARVGYWKNHALTSGEVAALYAAKDPQSFIKQAVMHVG